MIFSAGTASTLPNGDLLLTSAPERLAAWIAIFVVVAPLSWWLWRRRIGGNIPPGAFLVSWVIPLVIAPGIAMESVRVSNESLALKTGYWFAPTVMRYPLEGLHGIEEGKNVRGDLRWTFRYQTRVRTLTLPNLLESNRPPVVEALGHRGIRLTGAAS